MLPAQTEQKEVSAPCPRRHSTPDKAGEAVRARANVLRSALGRLGGAPVRDWFCGCGSPGTRTSGCARTLLAERESVSAARTAEHRGGTTFLCSHGESRGSGT